MEIYKQIYNDIQEKIQNNEIKQGEKLPSLIKLAKQYNCSKGTVIKSYDLLCQNHIVFTKPKSGYYVADNLLRNNDDQHNLYNMSTGNSLIESLSISDIKHCLNIAAELYAKNSIDLPLTGTESLNEYLPHYLAKEGIYAKQNNIYLIQGITQILCLLSQYEFPNHKKTILIEEPSFWNYVNFLKQTDLKVLTIQRTNEGINLKELESIFKNEDIKFFYLIPRNHNPLGTTLSYIQRKKIMQLAVKYDVYIIEDDYFGNTFQIPRYLPLFYFSPNKNCIYLRSISKNFPFIRIGFAIVPDEFKTILEEISEKSYYTSYHMPSLISQATFESYLKSNIYKKQEKYIHQEITRKLTCIKKITKNWNPNIIEVIGANSGYYFTLKLNPCIDSNYFISLLEKEKIYVTSNQPAYYFDNHFQNSIRLSIAIITLENLSIALEKIYSLALELISLS